METIFSCKCTRVTEKHSLYTAAKMKVLFSCLVFYQTFGSSSAGLNSVCPHKLDLPSRDGLTVKIQGFQDVFAFIQTGEVTVLESPKPQSLVFDRDCFFSSRK